jgi:hypothetical protein
MRLLHCFALPKEPDGKTYHHADWGFLTLSFANEG